MPQNHRLQFSVEETICFQKGQEVSELLSISLDPDIRVQEVNDYVSIRGSLELTGEYNIDQSKNAEEFYTDKRFVEEVRTREDGTAELTHCFPVDITIPKNKVSHLHEVFVFIDAFDYQLTDSRILTIQADLAIEGLLDDTADREPDIPLYEAPSEGFSEPPEFLVSEAEPFALEAENSEDSKTEEAPAGAPELHVSEAGFREEQKNEEEEAERSEPFALEADSEEIKANEAPAGAPELHVSEAGLREEQENEEEEAERSEPFALEADSEDIKTEETPAEAPELHVSEARLREEQANEEKETVRSESPALEAEGSEDINAAEAKQPELILSEAGLREEVETIEAAKAASGREIREKAETEEEQAELSDPLVLETEKSPAAEAERGEEKIEKSDSPILEHARRQESKETESELSDHIEPALRQEAEQLEEVRETVPENVVSLEESREQEKVPAALLKEAAAAPTLHFNQKISAEEESQEEELTPAYRTFLPEQDSEEHSFYSAPKLLEEEDQKEESFEIEVRKTPSPEEPEEETSFHSYQLPDTSDPERKGTDAVARDVPAAQTKEPETKENHNSLYLTKLFTREEDEFSRMKICIVQQEDTIERLCERYDITSQQLIRMNSLALDDELKAGQILYIPQYKSSHA
ncbi:LysM peptidoglycan-binding domain-containing protein [Bacillus mojavensis]|uniref:LysM peptidoglycan-binding domain-containing protein n=1 Tax=Bacillus mojavensis TaxID=72360 RepID=UPI0039A1EC3D